jgi:hypothetical protein
MIKKLASYLVIGIFISSCATPKAVDIMQANDEVMTCNELRLAFEKADLNEDEAHASKGVTNESLNSLHVITSSLACIISTALGVAHEEIKIPITRYEANFLIIFIYTFF